MKQQSLLQQFLDGASVDGLYQRIETKQYRQTSQQLQKNREELVQSIGDQATPLLLAYEESLNKLSFIQIDDFFIKGFRLGANLMLEIIKNDT